MTPRELEPEDAARKLAQILEKEGRAGGLDTSGIDVQPPDESESNCWCVVWESGPWQWGMYLSSGESIQFSLAREDRWSQATVRSVRNRVSHDPFEISEPGFGQNESLEPEFPMSGDGWYLETSSGQDVIFESG